MRMLREVLRLFLGLGTSQRGLGGHSKPRAKEMGVSRTR